MNKDFSKIVLVMMIVSLVLSICFYILICRFPDLNNDVGIIYDASIGTFGATVSVWLADKLFLNRNKKQRTNSRIRKLRIIRGIVGYLRIIINLMEGLTENVLSDNTNYFTDDEEDSNQAILADMLEYLISAYDNDEVDNNIENAVNNLHRGLQPDANFYFYNTLLNLKVTVESFLSDNRFDADFIESEIAEFEALLPEMRMLLYVYDDNHLDKYNKVALIAYIHKFITFFNNEIERNVIYLPEYVEPNDRDNN